MKITPGKGKTLNKMSQAIEDFQNRIKNLETMIVKYNNIFTSLGITKTEQNDTEGGGGGISEINVNTTNVTDGTNDSTLSDVTTYDSVNSQWKFYSVYKRYIA